MKKTFMLFLLFSVCHLSADINYAVSGGRIGEVRDYLEDGGDLDFIVNNIYGHNLLQEACFTNQYDIAKYLLEQGADPSATCKSWYPLHLVFYRDYKSTDSRAKDVANLLIGAGVDVDALTDKGDTALHLACRDARYVSSLQALVDGGASTDAYNNNCITPLMEAASHNHSKAVRILIAAKAEIEAVDKFNRTAFFHAAIKADIESLKLLLAAGADINTRDLSGKTPLMYAAKHSNLGVVKWLLANDADLSPRSNKNKSALDYAKDGKHPVIIKLLKN